MTASVSLRKHSAFGNFAKAVSALVRNVSRTKGSLLLAIALAAALPTPTRADAPLPMPTYGFNLGNTLESTWGYTHPTEAVFTTATAAGFNAVRVPCAWDYHADQTTHVIDPVFMAEVKQVVDWAIAKGMYVVINDHWDGGWLEENLGTSVDPAIDEKMHSYWTQIATEFADYDNHLLFAAANEPNVASPAVMNTLMAYYQTFVDAVRGVGGKNAERWLVLQSVSDPSWMNTLPEDTTPNRLMVEYHNYTPSLFTIIHDDQTWGDAMYFWGQAYHYDGNPSRNATWGEEGAIDAEMQKLADQYVSKGIPVLIGEFGAYRTTTLSGTEADYNNASRLYWDKYVAESAQAHGISPFYWSTQHDGLFDMTTGAISDPEAVAALTGGAAPPPPNGAPYAATGLVATASEGQIDVSWNATDGAATYNLFRSTESGAAVNTPFATGITGASYTDTDLNDGTTYFYQVAAVNSSGSSGFSPQAQATTAGVNPDPAQFSFETDPQGWTTTASRISGIETSAAQSFAGKKSLAVEFSGTTSGTSELSLSDVNVPATTTITFHVWIPSDSKVTAVEPYLQDYDWVSASTPYESLTADAWNTVTLAVPPTAVPSLKRLGIRFTTSAAWTGTCYVDSIAWDAQEAPFAPIGLQAIASAEKVALSWSDAATATAYKVKRSIKSGSDYTTIATTETASYTDSGLDDNATFFYVVTAVNDYGESVASTPASATTGATIEDWRTQHFDTPENSGDAADIADPDHDGSTNWQEFVSGTDPNDPASYLSIALPELNGNDIVIRFPSVSGKTYRVERSSTLLPESWMTVQDGISGTGDTIQVTDADGATHKARFYRLVVIQ